MPPVSAAVHPRRVAPTLRALPLVAAVLALGACGSSSSTGGKMAATTAPKADPRVGLKAGLTDAGTAFWNLKMVSNTPSSEKFHGVTNSDMAFTGPYVMQGNYNGFQVWDITNPASPALKIGYLCPASQSDVSVFRNLLFVSGEGFGGRTDCGTQGVPDTVSKDRLRGIRIFDITDIANPKYLANVQTCRGSHTHTVVNSPNDTENVYVYVSGSAPVRSPTELPGCSNLTPDKDPNSALFRIEVIKVPLAHPEQAAVVSSPRIFNDLAPVTSHGETPEDKARAAKAAADARAKGGFTAKIGEQEIVLPDGFTKTLLDSIVKLRGGTGDPTGADSAQLHRDLQPLVDKLVGSGGPKTGPTQCHDITVYPAIGLAGGACGGYGLLLDISDPANPKRIGAAADSNFSFWHSATFNNDGTKLLFSDEWGGGGQPRCRATDKKEWGADAIFTVADRKMTFKSYYKMPAAQTPQENCVAHNGSLIPVPGRDIMVQGWYQGGISVFDWTDASNPKEIAFFDRGPIDSTKMQSGGSWSVYWYNGLIISSEIARGLDILELTPSATLSQNEIDAAKTVKFTYLNVQDQQKFVWPASFALARAYLDQLEREGGMNGARISAVRASLAAAEKTSGAARSEALSKLSTELHKDATSAKDQAKAHMLAGAVGDLAKS
jgi:LVIVD repeat-containing protein